MFVELCLYNMSFVNCRELAPGTVSLTGDWVCGDDSKHTSYYSLIHTRDNLSQDAREPVFGTSNQV